MIARSPLSNTNKGPGAAFSVRGTPTTAIISFVLKGDVVRGDLHSLTAGRRRRADITAHIAFVASKKTCLINHLLHAAHR